MVSGLKEVVPLLNPKIDFRYDRLSKRACDVSKHHRGSPGVSGVVQLLIQGVKYLESNKCSRRNSHTCVASGPNIKSGSTEPRLARRSGTQ
jgi:hypothetical protein